MEKVRAVMKKGERGLLSLEACISVTIFIFFMLFLYSFFVVFEARNMMAHTVLATTKSLSLDSYWSSKMRGTGNLTSFAGFLSTLYNDPGFTEKEAWHELGDGETLDTKIVKERFIAYLSGEEIDSGATPEADKLLKRYHVVNGVDGLDFSQSTVESGCVKVVVTYELEYEFDVFGLDPLKMQQSACSKLWK